MSMDNREINNTVTQGLAANTISPDVDNDGIVETKHPDDHVPYIIDDVTTSAPNASVDHHYNIFPTHNAAARVSLIVFVLSLIMFISLLALYIIRQQRHKLAKRKAARRKRLHRSIYENHVDILNTEFQDMYAMERAFGTGVLVINDSPMVNHRLTNTRTGAAPIPQYLATAGSETETAS